MPGHEILLNIGGGVALLIWAARMIRTGILRAYGGVLRAVLARSTSNRFKGFAVGLAAAGLLQSATATALLAMSFAGRGLIATAPALAIMLGADVGSTLVVQVLSFDLSWFSPVMLLLGVLMFLAGRSAIWRHLGRVAIGLGLMLLSLTLIVGASSGLRDSEGLQTVLMPLANDPILAVLLAALLTWLAHSSVAMVLLIVSLTAAGVVPLALGLAMVLGANIGSGLIPMAISLSDEPAARRIPLGNLLFRTAGALAALVLMMLALNRRLMPEVAGFMGGGWQTGLGRDVAGLTLGLIGLVMPYLARIEADPARQIANFHTLFNLAVAFVFLPLIGPMARLTEKILPTPAADDQAAGKPRHLDRTAIAAPTVALSCAAREVLRLADMVETMLRDVITVFARNDGRLLDELSDREDAVDALHEAIKLYLTDISREALVDEDGERFVELITFTTNLEHVGDIIDNSLLPSAQKKIKRRLEFTGEGWDELSGMHARALDQMRLAINVFISRDVAMARRLLADKERFRELEREAGERHLSRLQNGDVAAIETSSLHLDMLRDLKRIIAHVTSIAYPILDSEGELRKSRLKKQDRESARTKAGNGRGGKVGFGGKAAKRA